MFKCNQIIAIRLLHSTQQVKFKFILGSSKELSQCLCSPDEKYIIRFESIRVYNRLGVYLQYVHSISDGLLNFRDSKLFR